LGLVTLDTLQEVSSNSTSGSNVSSGFGSSGSNISSGSSTIARGMATIVADLNSNFLLINLTWIGLSSNATQIHFYQGARGVNGPILLTIFNVSSNSTSNSTSNATSGSSGFGSGSGSNLSSSSSNLSSSSSNFSSPNATFGNATIAAYGFISGYWQFNSSVADYLRNGSVYLNILTSNYPTGEIRGQIVLYQAVECLPSYYLDQARSFNSTLISPTGTSASTSGSGSTSGTGTGSGFMGGSSS